MHRLIFYELDKIWRKRSFILSICVLMIVNLFLLWYINTPDSGETPLSVYKKFQKQIVGMSESKKEEYIQKLKETTEENYIDELYEEQQKVAGYKEYLRSVQESKDNLSSISIFKKQGQNDYAARNIEKSAKDYSGLSGKNIRWMPSKALNISMESVWTDLLLILSVFLFTGNLIFEEKDKKAFLYNKKYEKRSLAEWDCKDCGFIRPLHNYNYHVLRNKSDLCRNHYRLWKSYGRYPVGCELHGK